MEYFGDLLVHISIFCDNRTFLNIMQTRKTIFKKLLIQYALRFGHKFKLGRSRENYTFIHNEKLDLKTSFGHFKFITRPPINAFLIGATLADKFTYHELDIQDITVENLLRQRKKIIKPQSVPTTYKIILGAIKISDLIMWILSQIMLINFIASYCKK
jgi:hypothetical protein